MMHTAHSEWAEILMMPRKAQKKHTSFGNSILIGLALVHAVNIVDAYLSGVDASNQTAQVHLSVDGGMVAWSW